MSNEASHRDNFAVIALVITFLLRYVHFLSSDLLFGPFVDNVHVYGPLFSEASRLAAGGEIPYYLPSFGTGFPIFNNPDFSILYPFYFFGWLNYGGPLASLYTLTYVTLLHIFVFYVNLYVMLRCAAVAPWAAYLGASVGMLATNTSEYASWVTIASSYSWLPLLLAGAILLLRSPTRCSGIIVFSVAAGLLALAQPAQSVIHALLVCIITFTTGIAWLLWEGRFSETLHLIRSLVICSVLTFGLAGAAILPMYLDTGEMIRHVGNGNAVIGHAHIPWSSFNQEQLTFAQAGGILFSPNWISIVGSPYIGPLGLAGTLLTGIYFRRLDPFRRMLVVVFSVIALYGLLSAFGTNLGFAYLNFHLPFINRIREAGRHLVLFVIGASFLSGIGYGLLPTIFQEYKRNYKPHKLVVPALLAIGFVTVILWEIFHNGLVETAQFFQSPATVWMLALAPLLVVLALIWKSPSREKIVTAALLVSAAAIVVPTRGHPAAESSFYEPLNILSHRVIRSFVNKIDVSDYRIDFLDKFPNLPAFPTFFWGINASYYGMKSFYNHQSPQPDAQFRFSKMANIPHLREMMGARYVLCGPSNSPPDESTKEILATDGYRLYENPKPMGRLTLLHRIAGPYKSESDFRERISQGFDYFSEAYIDYRHFDAAQDFLGRSQRLPSSSDRVVKIVDQANRSYAEIESDSPSLLILNEWFTPAWKVRVNVKNQPVLRVNHWQLGVLLSAGKNRVEFEYRPTLFRMLMLLNRITILSLLVFTAFAAFRNRQTISASFHTC